MLLLPLVLDPCTQVAPGCINFVQPNPMRGPVVLADLAGLDPVKCLHHVTGEEYARLYTAMNEWLMIQCDRVSRETGRLTKSVRLLTLKQCDARKLLNKEYLKRDGDCSRKMEDCYPQLLGAVLILDPPRWVLTVWRGLRYLFPVRFVEKLDLISSARTKELHHRVLQYLALEDLPSDFGGWKAGPWAA